MSDARFDVCAIGNAIVDVLAQAEDSFLDQQGLPKGAMSLIDADRAQALYSLMGPGVETSGGSAGNTAAGIAALGGKVAYIGKVADDQLGDVFRHDISAVGVTFSTPPISQKLPTARSFIFVTPDAQRTMQTFLGACTLLGPDDIDIDTVANSQVVFIEGYLWDLPAAIEGILKAAKAAKSAGRKVSFTTSDPFCVGRFRDQFLDFIRNDVDILFCNEAEILSLFQTEDFDAAVEKVRGMAEIVAVTRSEKGSVIVTKDETHIIPAQKVDVVDTTGAGDAYAAGFLYGYTQGKPLDVCGKLGGLVASEAISHYGARAETDLKALVASAL
ncbi:MAG TPA: adenosine kinase [Dehalococcoidia bacterium]|jgi:sugar/nucleoside kinase (ribokinase family)|nr:adenosine kinase [Dehalococcoidia bacterium]